ncbi:MAG: hypothetical protein ACPHUH_07425, partial [Porticoccaceae bacterium]
MFSRQTAYSLISQLYPFHRTKPSGNPQVWGRLFCAITLSIVSMGLSANALLNDNSLSLPE